METRFPEIEPATDDATDDAAGKQLHFVVGIGASAGGLEALEQFFEKMPEKTGLAFVVVQHLSPDFRSLMDELLARRTAIPIRRVEDGMEIEPRSACAAGEEPASTTVPAPSLPTGSACPNRAVRLAVERTFPVRTRHNREPLAASPLGSARRGAR